ncbi:LysM peptidoglycan-binding domain-containing protein [Paenibacillus cisolokensis]|uniref:LysM peptidoglycan-binding domain-containing protein n=1 Tax=Paenibacillus cisolokensis TaxID=1658519 RepID=UPI003D2CD020
MKIHIVKKGESLYLISQKYNVSVEDIVKLNPSITDPNKIDVGMKLKIPSAPVKPGGIGVMHHHVVQQGDTLWKLSKAWGIPLGDLIKANPQLNNPNVLTIGEIVYIPKAAADNTVLPDQANAENVKPNTLSAVIGVKEWAGKLSTLPIPGKKPTEKKPTEKKPTEQKPVEQKAAETKPIEKKATEPKPAAESKPKYTPEAKAENITLGKENVPKFPNLEKLESVSKGYEPYVDLFKQYGVPATEALSMYNIPKSPDKTSKAGDISPFYSNIPATGGEMKDFGYGQIHGNIPMTGAGTTGFGYGPEYGNVPGTTGFGYGPEYGNVPGTTGFGYGPVHGNIPGTTGFDYGPVHGNVPGMTGHGYGPLSENIQAKGEAKDYGYGPLSGHMPAKGEGKDYGYGPLSGHMPAKGEAKDYGYGPLSGHMPAKGDENVAPEFAKGESWPYTQGVMPSAVNDPYFPYWGAAPWGAAPNIMPYAYGHEGDYSPYSYGSDTPGNAPAYLHGANPAYGYNAAAYGWHQPVYGSYWPHTAGVHGGGKEKPCKCGSKDKREESDSETRSSNDEIGFSANAVTLPKKTAAPRKSARKTVRVSSQPSPPVRRRSTPWINR